MIAKFHSAPGHSMETTLTINLPSMQEIKVIRAQNEKDKEREKVTEKEMKDQEKKDKKQRKREEQQRAKEATRQRDQDMEFEKQMENEKDKDSQASQHAGGSRVQAERTGSYKDKFQKMREKYDKVTSVFETSERELELLNAKIKKLQAENDLLLDAMLTSETDLYERYFDRSASSSPVPDPTLPPPTSQSSQNQSQALTPRSAHYRDPPPPQSGSSASVAGSMAPPASGGSSASTVGPPGSAGLRPMPPPLPPMPAMPPPSSASSNGTVTSNGANSTNTMPPPSSTASSNGTGASPSQGRRAMWNANTPPFMSGTPRSRRRSSAEAGSVPLAPEDVGTNGDGPRAATRTPTPMALDAQQDEDEPIRTSRVNGNSSPTVTPHAIAVNGNGINSRRQTEASRETTPVREPTREGNEVQADDDHFMELDADDDVGPASPGPEAGAGVHSPIDGEEDSDAEEREMEVDEEPRSPADISRRASFGSLLRSGRG